MTLEVEISKLYSSPSHNYFTREKFDIGTAPTYEHQFLELEVGKGIKDDRFEFSTYPLTFMSEEVMLEVCNKLSLQYKPELFRRNIVISKVHLNSLIGKRFEIDGVVFEGMEHCSPCPWMNAVMRKGVYKLMQGRGGLRAKVLKDGLLKTGTNTLVCCELSEVLDPLLPLKKPRIPS